VAVADSVELGSSPHRSARGLDAATGVAVAFGLSTCGIVVGALLAVVLETIELLPDGWWPLGWVLLAAIGTAAAGATVREVAGRLAPWSIGIAGVLVFFGVHEISSSIEATGAEGPELPVSIGLAVAFVALLSLGAVLDRRRHDRVDPVVLDATATE